MDGLEGRQQILPDSEENNMASKRWVRELNAGERTRELGNSGGA